MANFDRSGMTQAGINLMGKAMAGATIQFTRLMLGDGTMTGEILDLQGVVSPKQNVDVTRIERNDNQCTVGGELLTSSIKQGFFWRECGLYAMDPDAGEILYNYAYSTKPDYIAASDSGMMEEILVAMVATVGSNTNVNITVDDSMVFATKKVVDKKPYFYKNIEMMKADTSLKMGDMAITMGYHHPGDLGGCEYTIVGVDEVDGYFITLNNGLKAKMIIKGGVANVKQFGAAGDGITNDAECIKLAIENCYNKTLQVNDGVYLVDESIIITDNIQLKFGNSKIITNSELEFIIGFSKTSRINDVEIENMHLDGRGIAKIGLYIQDTSRARFSKLKVDNCVIYNIKADRNGNSGECSFIIDGADLRGGIWYEYESCIDAIGIYLDATDCIIKDVNSRDFITHIYAKAGWNLYKECHGWNLHDVLINNSCYIKLESIASIISCYADTVQNGIKMSGSGYINVSDFTYFLNRQFYTDDKNEPIPLSVDENFIGRFKLNNGILDSNGYRVNGNYPRLTNLEMIKEYNFSLVDCTLIGYDKYPHTTIISDKEEWLGLTELSSQMSLYYKKAFRDKGRIHITLKANVPSSSAINTRYKLCKVTKKSLIPNASLQGFGFYRNTSNSNDIRQIYIEYEKTGEVYIYLESKEALTADGIAFIDIIGVIGE